MRHRVVVFGAATVIAGCMAASSAISATPPSSAPVALTHRVRIASFRYHPDTLRVTPGDTVVFVNNDRFGHTASSRSGALETSLIAAGDSARWIAATEGSVDYICTFHPSMRGVIVVASR